MGEETVAPIWSDALRAAALLAADPLAGGGVVLRAGAGPVRDLWLSLFQARLPPGTPWRRLPPGIADDRLLGGLDLAATLRAGRPVAQSGLLAEADGGIVVVPMAERLSAGIVAKLCAVLDTGTVSLERDGLQGAQPARFGLVLLDEGDEDETVAEALADRLAFRIHLSGIGLRDISAPVFDRAPSHTRPHAEAPARSVGLAGASPKLPLSLEASFKAADAGAGGIDGVAALCATAVDLGIASLRAPLLAARVARLAARLDGRDEVREAEVVEAARLVLAPRAARLPTAEPSDRPQPDPPSDTGDQPPPESEERDAETTPNLDDIVLEAARAAIPANLLAQLLAGGPRLRAARSGRMGASSSNPRSGRPAGSRPGDPRRGRLDLIATLRAAAPWQRLRRGGTKADAALTNPVYPEVRGEAEPRRSPPGIAAGSGGLLRGRRFAPPPQDEGVGGITAARLPRRIIVLPDDLRIKRLVQRSETTTIFCVDASGSSAIERLAEAKGAVELLLAESYVRRDRVALVAFRGVGAEVILPPTRSLVRAKRALGGLPGGGGTPLASGIDAAATLALAVKRGGGSPILVLLTDGRANVARSGEGGRARAGEEALEAGRMLRALGLRTLVIDTGARPDGARRLAEVAEARYIPLPYADAGAMSAAVKAAVA